MPAMKVLTGIDMVPISRIREMKKNTGFLARAFHASELASATGDDQLAGLFAAKEAAIKAFGLSTGSWLDLEISHLPSGKPVLNIRQELIPNFSSFDVSISHEADMACACVVALAKS